MPLILITGGCRSGKSAHAQQWAESLPGRRAYVATCPVVDDEMRQRIDRHQQDRRDRGWETIEEQTDLVGVLRGNDHDVLLVDCLTLWINNLMFEAEKQQQTVDEDQIADQCRAVLEVCRKHPGTILFVTNEVGQGIVPENPLARRYRDLVGRCNQVIAAEVDNVTLVSCGIPLTLKGNPPT